VPGLLLASRCVMIELVSINPNFFANDLKYLGNGNALRNRVSGL
jgi:hypothetical protein